ncbi:uncharacterized protein CcaverHIS019_0500930 [Cutaneotrichosporon cavernicola]|uniref:WW domain-containing protein n=1 Tax=Cutaneotrichosporon cavernicola TaxID=279322 RepID=A0AA48L5T6_9TREE|nr:uncharacterized protein CcaverHIS019_0500930 [Cutaneotrichosporon cavernicola]BEI92465.1 hypothetical protein CcaverHIS019_0500930 [Cutaneotrichosporon cavernicola]BEJ00237.1 hypothetical protein CcaverHIS631_0500940 [Cutaneotrichosporon cavernicola]BEJ08008.1 hypothetical protein CcaverHIS641_0500930 [Cutaneotrichosporon cavernicola]
MASPPSSLVPPVGAYSSPCLPPEWMWQYSPELDEVYFIHPPTDQRAWEHPQGKEAETAFYQWLGGQLGAGGFGGTPPPTSPPLNLNVPDGGPLNRSISAPTASGAAAEFYSLGPVAHEYPDAFSTSVVPPMLPDGPMDRGLFTHGFGKPVKSSAGWSFKLKDFFVGDFQYRPPPPRPQPLKPSHLALMGPAPGSSATHAPTYGTFKPPSIKYGRPNSYSEQYPGPDPLVTPFPLPEAPKPPSVPSHLPPSYQQSLGFQSQSQNPYGATPFPQPATTSPYQQPGQFGATPPQPQTSPYNQHQQLPGGNPYPPRPTSAYPPRPSGNPYPLMTQPNYGPSPTMNALSQAPSGGSGYVPSYNNYAPRPPNVGGYVPGKINAGAFKPRPRGMDDDEDWTEQPVEWSQPVYGGPDPSPPLPPHGQWSTQGQWQ